MKHPPPPPPPLPGSGWVGGACGFGGGVNELKFAVQVVSAFSVIVPTQAPCCQPLNCDVLSADGVSVICVPARNWPWHSVPQSTPAGDEVTRPMPLPLRLTVRLFMPPMACTLWLPTAAT